MTDRIKGLTVFLEDNVREDDADVIMSAISLLRGVTGVDKHLPKTDDYMIEQRTKADMFQKLAEVLC